MPGVLRLPDWTRRTGPPPSAIFTGVLAKEAIVARSTRPIRRWRVRPKLESHRLRLKEALQAALATIPRNLADAMAGWLDPLGLEYWRSP